MSDNPFQAPEAANPYEIKGQIWRSGKKLVMNQFSQLPNRCIKCNQPEDVRLTRKLAWHHPAFALLILCGVIVYLIVALIIQKKAVIEIGLCNEHNGARKMAKGIAWGLVILGIGSCTGGLEGNTDTLTITGLLLVLTSVIFGLRARVVTPAKITDDMLWLKGTDESFLQNFPEYPDPKHTG